MRGNRDGEDGGVRVMDGRMIPPNRRYRMSMIPDNVQPADWSVFGFQILHHSICKPRCVM